MTFRYRLASLGYCSYEAYLRSPHWKRFKKSYRDSGLSMTCAVCQRKPIQLHHHDYSRLGAELLTDVDPLCGDHHNKVHDLLKREKKSVKATKWAIGVLCQKPKPENRKNKDRLKLSPEELKARKETASREKARRRKEFKATHNGKSRREWCEEQAKIKIVADKKLVTDKWADPVWAMQAIASGLRRPAKFC